MPADHAATLLIAAYLMGAISPSYHLGRAIRGVDLRDVGSHNLGARNAGRVLGRRIGITVWALDAAKGALATGLALATGGGTLLAIGCGAAAVVGHNWPAYYGFRGGRGASCALGASLVLLPIEMSVGFGLWGAVWHVSGSLYLGGLIAFPAATVLAFVLGGSGLRALSPLLVAVPLMLRHVPAMVEMIRRRTLRFP